MATFEIKTPQGTFEITAPDEQTALNALNIQFGSGQQEQPLTGLDYVAGLADTAAQGLTLGAADELAAGLQAALGRTNEGGFFDYGGTLGERYEQNLARERDVQEQFARENPATAFGAELAGAAVPLVAGGVASPAIAGSRTLGAAATGAAEGGAFGFLSGEGGFGERAQGAAIGAPVGAAGGAIGERVLAPAIRSTLEGATRAIRSLSKSDKRTARGVQFVLRKAQEAGITPAEMAMRVRRGEVPGQQDPVMMDVTRAAKRSPESGAARKTIIDRLEEGFAGNQERVNRETRRLLGGQDNFNVWLDDFKKARGKAARNAYRSVFSQPQALGAGNAVALRDLLPRVPSSAVRDAVQTASVTGRPFPSDLVSEITEDGVVFSRVPNLEEAEMIRRGLKSATGQAFRDGRGEVGVALRELEQEFRTVIDNASPQLKRIRANYAGEKAIEEAADLGQRLLNMSADEAEFVLRGMSSDELQAVRNGVADSVKSMVERGQINRDVIKRIYGTERYRRILNSLFKDEKQGRRFFRDMETMADFNDLRSVVMGNSRTQQDLADATEMNAGGMIGMMREAAKGSPRELTINVLEKTVKALTRMPQEGVEAMADMLMSDNPREVIRLIRLADQGDRRAIVTLNSRVRSILDAAPTALGGVTGGEIGQRMTTGEN